MCPGGREPGVLVHAPSGWLRADFRTQPPQSCFHTHKTRLLPSLLFSYLVLQRDLSLPEPRASMCVSVEAYSSIVWTRVCNNTFPWGSSREENAHEFVCIELGREFWGVVDLPQLNHGWLSWSLGCKYKLLFKVTPLYPLCPLTTYLLVSF